MARPVWSGSISFGMVSLPVKLVPAVKKKSVSFNQLDRDTMSRIRYRKVSEATGEEVPSERIVRAANVGGDTYVVVEDDELEALAPKKSKEIAIEAFVPADQIDPLRYDASYHLLPDTNAKPYALLASALGGTGRVGIGRFVMRQREHVAAIRSDGERLQLSTLVFDDEMVGADTLSEFEVLEAVELSDRELDMARTLVEAMSEDFEPGAVVDEYRAAVDALVQSKAEGGEPVAAATADERSNVIDLAEALEQSLRQAEAARERHPSGGAAAKRTPAAKKASATKAPAKRSAGGKAAATKAPAKKSAGRKAAATKAPAKKAMATPRRKSA